MTQRQNTKNPCPSNALADLNDNTIIIDEWVNSENDYTIDRFGNQFKTKHKILNDLKKSIEEIENKSFLPMSGGTVSGTLNAKTLKENDVRVYSPNNKPTPEDIGSIPAIKKEVNGAPIYMVGSAIDAVSISVKGKSVITDVSEIQSKLTELNNRVYVTESYQNGDSWYRVYSDGFIEQSSVINVTTGRINAICETLVNLIKPMRTRNYGVTVDRINAGGWARVDFAYAELYEASFRLASFSSYTCQSPVRWTVRGY